LFKSLQSKEA
jgi:chromosome segregation ATPase